MTETEWLASDNAGDMIRFSRSFARGSFLEPTSRKYRLFACACVRRTQDLTGDELSQGIVLVAERLADGQVGREDLAEARSAGATGVARKTLLRSARMAANDVCWPVGSQPILASLLRCIFGNPFQTVSIHFACRTPTIVSLARAAYDERLLPGGELDPERLTVLADAIEEAGGSVELREHLRGEALHVRGCHVIDALTGRS